MSNLPTDFRVEIIQARPQGVANATLGAVQFATPIDITSRVTRESFGSINRALERDLLSFKTGDLTLAARNHDGFFDDLFAFFGATDIWSLRVFRRGAVQFWGCLIGKGSILFDDKAKECEVTAYGLTKILDMTSAGALKRSFDGVTFTAAVPGTITISSTAGLVTGDILHITDQTDEEDFTVKQVLSGTTLSPVAALVNTYAFGSPVTLTTPFPRAKTIDYLVDALFTAAGIPLADLRLSPSQFRHLAPTPVNLEGVSLLNNARRGTTQYLGAWNVGIHFGDDYSQNDPDTAWFVQGIPDRGVYDWTPYFTQAEQQALNTILTGLPAGEPVKLFEPVVGNTQESVIGNRYATYWGGCDEFSNPRRIWGMTIGLAGGALIQDTTVDGATYGGTTSTALPVGASNDSLEPGVEYDPDRDIVYACWKTTATNNRYFYYRDLGGAAWVDCKQTDDGATTGYFGPRYVKELDGVLVLRCDTNSSTGPTFEICLFRGSARVWKQPFPDCLIAEAVSGNPAFYPTRTARYVNGSIYITLVSDGAVQLVRSDDLFATYIMRQIVAATTSTIIMATRVQDTYRIACYRSTAPTGYYICAPLYGGVIDYADFAGMSVAGALNKLAILADALYWTDDDLEGHFVARDLYDAGAVLEVGDRVIEQKTDLLWDETSQYVTVSGGGFDATSGDNGFATEGIDLESSLIPTEAFAQALADAYFDTYSAARKMLEVTLHDTDGHIYRPLDRVAIDGFRFMVYESDHSLMDDEAGVTLLEDR